MAPSYFMRNQYDGPDIPIELPEVTTASVIGISVAIAGNVLISLALNFQKLAHRRLEREKIVRARERLAKEQGNANGNGSSQTREGDGDLESVTEAEGESSHTGLALVETEPVAVESPAEEHIRLHPSRLHLLETEPLFPAADPTPGDPRRDYGSRSRRSSSRVRQLRSQENNPKRTFISRLTPFRLGLKRSSSRPRGTGGEETSLPVDVMTEDAALNNGSNGKNDKPEDVELLEDEEGNESDYLKSKLWWFGFLLMNVGELGNFISYAFAPASVVAPLGTFALIANCVFAPLMLNERFRKLDLLGILIAIIGAVTVVLASNTSDVRLDPAGLVRAISQRAFVIYACVYAISGCILVFLSEGGAGKRWVFVDVGLCALFGGFTVLSTKGISTLITLEWIEMFTEWITYPVIVVLIGTGVGQIRYLNRALMRFDSKVVIPIQFVLFNLSAIVGSAILYGDFKKATFHQFVTFLYGCAATFAGVFIIAWAPSSAPAAHLPEPSSQPRPQSEEGHEDRLGMGTLGRRNRAALVLPSGAREGAQPILRKKRSTVSLMGISPAQHLLLVHTPPRDGVLPPRPSPHANFNSNPDLVRRDSSALSTPDSNGRRRAISWFGEERGDGGRARALARLEGASGETDGGDRGAETRRDG